MPPVNSLDSTTIYLVCDWLGNSQALAMTHFDQVTDEHFSRAVGRTPKPKRSVPAVASITLEIQNPQANRRRSS